MIQEVPIFGRTLSVDITEAHPHYPFPLAQRLTFPLAALPHELQVFFKNNVVRPIAQLVSSETPASKAIMERRTVIWYPLIGVFANNDPECAFTYIQDDEIPFDPEIVITVDKEAQDAYKILVKEKHGDTASVVFLNPMVDWQVHNQAA